MRTSAGIRLATQILDELHEATCAHPGVTRVSYGAGEQVAHDIVTRHAQKLGATVRVDAAGNLYLVRPGSNPALPAIFMGSHLDSVPHGGNYDGAAGVVAGLAVLAELEAQQQVLPRTVTVMATRAEEAVWFPLSYPGAEAAFGTLPITALDARRFDSGLTLAEHLRISGFNPDAIARGEPQIATADIAAFVELHIEQGPRLEASKHALGIVSAINGGFRFTDVRCFGSYAHSGAEPRFSRQDSVLGVSDLIQELEKLWDELERNGHELTITIGRIESDSTQHGGSRVLGKVSFSIDVRCEHQNILDEVENQISQLCSLIEAKRRVRFELGSTFKWEPKQMNRSIMARLRASADRRGLDAVGISSGAGHDSAVFAKAGVATAMLFVRNTNGSHNPDEHLEMDDLDAGIMLLLDFVQNFDVN